MVCGSSWGRLKRIKKEERIEFGTNPRKGKTEKGTDSIRTELRTLTLEGDLPGSPHHRSSLTLKEREGRVPTRFPYRHRKISRAATLTGARNGADLALITVRAGSGTGRSRKAARRRRA
jgi:hypothetical protein